MSIRSGAGLGAGLVPVEANGVNPGYPGCQSSFPTLDHIPSAGNVI